MKSYFYIFILVVITVTFSGCATTGGTGGAPAGSAGGSKSTLTDADFKRMGISKDSYGNSY